MGRTPLKSPGHSRRDSGGTWRHYIPLPGRSPAAGLLMLLPAMTFIAAPAFTEPRVTGTVIDAATLEPLALANVYVQKTVLGDATDDRGRFEITGVPDGEHLLAVSMMGYRTATRGFVLEPGDSVQVEIELQPTAIEIDPVVVSASRRQTSLSEAPVSSNVVGRPEIAKRDVYSPPEVLRHVPGVTITETQASIRGSTGFVRGAGSRILLLVDGVPALAGDTGDIKWDIVPTEQIERIEIVKSASSSLYGSSALGGVINIVTNGFPERPLTRLRLSAGYYDDPYWRQWKWTSDWLSFGGIDISHSRRTGPAGVLLSLSYKGSDGYRQNSDFDMLNAMAKVTARLNLSNYVTGFATWSTHEYGHTVEWKSQSQALEVDESTLNDRVRSDKLTGYLRLRTVLNPASVLFSTFNLYANSWRNDFHDAQDESDALRLGGSVQLERVLHGTWDAILGAEGWHTGVKSTMFGDRDIGEAGVLGELEMPVGKRFVPALALRYDIYYRDDRSRHSEVNPRATLRFDAGRISLMGSAGKGFRAPTVAEMYTSASVGGYRVKPNPGLRPESAITYEIGATGEFIHGLIAGAAVFRSDYRDLIEPDIDPSDGNLHFVNVGDARIEGLDTWLAAAAFDECVGLRLAYMYLSAEDTGRDQPLPYRSRHSAKVSLDLRGGNYLLGADYVYRSRVEAVKVYPEDERVSTKVLDMRGAVDIGSARLSLKVANLLNYNYAEIERNLAPIRSLSFSLSTDF